MQESETAGNQTGLLGHKDSQKYSPGPEMPIQITKTGLESPYYLGVSTSRS